MQDIGWKNYCVGLKIDDSCILATYSIPLSQKSTEIGYLTWGEKLNPLPLIQAGLPNLISKKPRNPTHIRWRCSTAQHKPFQQSLDRRIDGNNMNAIKEA